jgi:hypothetical protein
VGHACDISDEDDAIRTNLPELVIDTSDIDDVSFVGALVMSVTSAMSRCH